MMWPSSMPRSVALTLLTGGLLSFSFSGFLSRSPLSLSSSRPGRRPPHLAKCHPAACHWPILRGSSPASACCHSPPAYSSLASCSCLPPHRVPRPPCRWQPGPSPASPTRTVLTSRPTGASEAGGWGHASRPCPRRCLGAQGEHWPERTKEAPAAACASPLPARPSPLPHSSHQLRLPCTGCTARYISLLILFLVNHS